VDRGDTAAHRHQRGLRGALPNLTNPAFDNATTNGAPANLKASEKIDLIDSNGNVIGTASNPDAQANGFAACTWATTC
jgi:hypothetical protein